MDRVEQLPVWDLKTLYRSEEDDALKSDMSLLESLAGEFRNAYHGRIASLEATELLEAFSKHAELYHLFGKLSLYAHLRFAENTASTAAQKLVSNIEELSARVHSLTVFFDLELGLCGEAFLNDPALSGERYFIEKSVKTARYKLSEELESYGMEKDLSGKEVLVGMFDELFGQFRFEMETPEGKRTFTSETALAALHSPDRDYRTSVFETFLSRVGDEKIVLTNLYNGIMLDHRLDCKRRGFTDVIEPRNIRNEVSSQSVLTMLSVVESGYELARRYFRMKGDYLKLSDFTNADIYSPIATSKLEVPFEDAKELVLSAYSRFDPRAGALVSDFFETRRVETPPRDGKRPGAFCYGASNRLDAFVFMNYTAEIRSVETLAHELGHGLHHQLAKKQNHLYFSTPLVTAETASVFGEILLNDLLVERAADPTERLAILCSQMEGIIATVFRQTVLTRFEQRAHAARTDGKVPAETLCDLWWQANHELYGDVVRMVDPYRWGWGYIPHFVHTPFYCYAYSYGQLLVLALYHEYKKRGTPFIGDYLDLLAAGGSDAPVALVKRHTGLDMEHENFWQGALSLLEEMLDEIEQLINSSARETEK